jgi:hypothetical protein
VATDIYRWPNFVRETDLDNAFADWAQAVHIELNPVSVTLSKPLPDDPYRLDQMVTKEVEGWMPRVAALAVIAEYFLSQAKLEKLPPKARAADGKPLTTEADRSAYQEAALGQYRFVRDLLDAYTNSLRERIRWAQSVRKQHGEAQF